MLASIFKADLFRGKTALVTGGGTGIGLRIARELGALGAHVVIASRDEAHLNAGLAVLAAEGCRAGTQICNIRSEESVRNCIDAVVAQAGPIDLLVNNAGGQFPSPAAEISHKGWHAVIETNLTGTFLVSKEVFNRGMKERGGSIVNVIANFWRGFPLMSHTGAARAGVDNLTKSLAVEWGHCGVRVNAVAPGVIASAALNNYGEAFQPFIRAARTHNQAYRLGTEAEVASAVCFLLSPGAAFISGTTLAIDGGARLYSPLCPPREHDRMPVWDDRPED